MRILLVAPQPFYSERGTPIAVRILAESLCSDGHQVHLLTYHLGEDIFFPNLTLFRSAHVPGIREIPIGISLRKIFCDVLLTIRLARMLWTGKYDVVHAVEESLFPAVLLNMFSKRRLIYDMDSLLSEQLTDKWRAFRPALSFLEVLERTAIQKCDRVFAVCQDLADKVSVYVPKDLILVLPDVPLPKAKDTLAVESLRKQLVDGELLLLYVGNLERYQGVGLLLDALAEVGPEFRYKLLVIGGEPAHIKEHAESARTLGVADRVVFLGPRPIAGLSSYLDQADILVSPRTLGQNTPMKVYSYMQAGKAILATRIRSHTQVLDDSCALLAEPSPAPFANALKQLLADVSLRTRLGAAALNRVESEFSLTAFRSKLRHAYAGLAEERA